MQKLSETVYASLFWLISGLLVWLVILPISFIYFLVVLASAAGQALFQMLESNLVEAQRKSQTNPESQPLSAGSSLLTSLLVMTLVEVPALLAAIVSLQPTRLIKGKQVFVQMIQSQPEKLSTDTTKLPTEE
jgi:ABC-type multidrug transport system permease subunit